MSSSRRGATSAWEAEAIEKRAEKSEEIAAGHAPVLRSARASGVFVHEVLERVLNHSVDVAILGKPPADDRLVAARLTDNEIVCITAPDDPAVGQGRQEAVELAGRRWLLREAGSGTRTLNEQFLTDRGLDPSILTLGSNGAIKQAARAGLGVSLVSRAAVEGELASGWLGELKLKDGPAKRSWFVLRAAVGPVRPPVEMFIAFARDAARQQRA